MRISDWSSDVCSSDLLLLRRNAQDHFQQVETAVTTIADFLRQLLDQVQAETADRAIIDVGVEVRRRRGGGVEGRAVIAELQAQPIALDADVARQFALPRRAIRSAVCDADVGHLFPNQTQTATPHAPPTTQPP